MATEYPPRTTSLDSYGAVDSTYSSSGPPNLTFTSASMSIPTTKTNTRWEVVVSADVNAPIGLGAVALMLLQIIVDGNTATTDGVKHTPPSAQDSIDTRTTVTGRQVVTLAT